MGSLANNTFKVLGENPEHEYEGMDDGIPVVVSSVDYQVIEGGYEITDGSGIYQIIPIP